VKLEKKYDIFISYRRDGGQETARILRDSLTERGYKVFFDVESLRSGAFNTRLYSVIEECTDFIIVLSPNALDRCVNEDDWVRKEVEHALKKKKNVIPILLRNFEFPADLPESMDALRYQNGLAANMEYYDAFVDKLVTFFYTKQTFWKKILEFLQNMKSIPVLLAAAALLTGGIFGFHWFNQYPRTAKQINLTEGVIANVGYNLSNLNVLIKTHAEVLDAAEDCLVTGEQDVCASRFAVCYNALEKDWTSQSKPDDALLARMEGGPFNPEELSYMYNMVVSFQEQTLETLAYMEFIISEDCVLSVTEKRETVSLYQDYLNKTVEWFRYCANEMLLPVTNEEHLETFWHETLPYLTEISLSQNNWSRDKEALVEAGNECYEKMQEIQAELNSILGDSTMALRQDQANVRQELVDAGYTKERAEKIVSYMSRDWEAELTESYIRKGYSENEAAALAKEEAEQKEWELDVLYTLSARTTDDVNIIWEKMTYLLDLGFYEEAEECVKLYQASMTNSDRYMPALVLYMQMKQQGTLDHGIMVMEYYEEDGVNDQLMIGDIIYRFNGEDCASTADYLSRKEALTDDSYTIKLLRLAENYEVEVLELTLSTDSPRVYLNDLLPAAEE